MKIFLCRHGETTGDVEDRYGGFYNDSLSKKGFKQASELGEKLSGLNIQLVIHSPLIRAKETAIIVAKKLGVETKEKLELCERNHYGLLTGMKKSDALKKFPTEVMKFKIDPLRPNVIGGEDYEVFKKRVIDIFLHIRGRNHHDKVAVITHGGPIKCIVREILKLGEIKQINDCAILEIESNLGKVKLVSIDGAELESNKN
ncbi:MAG: histidine phosphatase family protein [archaeon]